MLFLAAAGDVLPAAGGFGVVASLGALAYKYIDISRGQRKILDDVEDRVQKMLKEEADVAVRRAARIEADSKEALAKAIADCDRLVKESDGRCDAKLAALAAHHATEMAAIRAEVRAVKVTRPRPRKTT